MIKARVSITKKNSEFCRENGVSLSTLINTAIEYKKTKKLFVPSNSFYTKIDYKTFIESSSCKLIGCNSDEKFYALIEDLKEKNIEYSIATNTLN